MRIDGLRRLQSLARQTAWPLAFMMGACAGPEPRTDAPGLRIGNVLGSGPAGAEFARAKNPRVFEFPADHGTHPEFRSEWWYLILALQDGDGREFGVQFTIFRQALFPGGPANDPWRNGQAYLGHFAVTDVEAGLHREAERLSRGHPALAGARAARADDPLVALVGAPTITGKGTRTGNGTPTGSPIANGTPTRRTPFGTPTESAGAIDMKEIHTGGPHRHEGGFSVWLEGWQLTGNGDNWKLEAAADGFAVSMSLVLTKPIVLQGDRGLSPKGPGQASYYYSVPRLQASGHLQVDNNDHAVSGIGWLDREWSTSVLGAHQVGWDWFALMLDNGEDIMAFRLRRDDGGRDPYDHGVLVDASGRARYLGSREFSLEPLDYWRDERGTEWPIRWALTVEERQWLIEAPVRNQRMDTLLTYWEGLVHVLDQRGVRSGRGYMELTGYR